MLISSIVLVLLVLLIRIGYSKKTKTVPASASGETLQIGKYIFHYEQHVVYYEGLKIPLTSERIEVALHFFQRTECHYRPQRTAKRSLGK
jgi:DNA-binding response OmpR family regulator